MYLVSVEIFYQYEAPILAKKAIKNKQTKLQNSGLCPKIGWVGQPQYQILKVIPKRVEITFFRQTFLSIEEEKKHNFGMYIHLLLANTL